MRDPDWYNKVCALCGHWGFLHDRSPIDTDIYTVAHVASMLMGKNVITYIPFAGCRGLYVSQRGVKKEKYQTKFGCTCPRFTTEEELELQREEQYRLS